jgi:hypothetical protein
MYPDRPGAHPAEYRSAERLRAVSAPECDQAAQVTGDSPASAGFLMKKESRMISMSCW